MKLTLLPEGIITEKHGVSYDYSCVMYELPDDIAQKIINWGNDNIKDEWIYEEDDDSLGREDHIHITVKYGLHDSDPDCISELIGDFGSFDIKLGEISKFESSDDYDVIKLSVDSDRLHKLNKLISDNVETTDKYPTYQPHVTIAYVDKGTCDHLLGEAVVDAHVSCDEVLFSSKNKDMSDSLSINKSG